MKLTRLEGQIIIYRELRIAKKLEVKVFDCGGDDNNYEKFMDDFIERKKNFINDNLWKYNKDLDLNSVEYEEIMTPWETVDFINFERIEIGGANIGYGAD